MNEIFFDTAAVRTLTDEIKRLETELSMLRRSAVDSAPNDLKNELNTFDGEISASVAGLLSSLEYASDVFSRCESLICDAVEGVRGRGEAT